MIGFHWKRGNIESELKRIGYDRTAAELEGLDLYKIKSVYEKVILNGSKKSHNKGEVIYIYVLIDPRNLAVRYVGKTNNPYERMRSHISPHIYMRHNNLKCIWTEELKSLGLNPIMQILCTCKPEESELYEYRYYKLFKEGCDLLNSATILKETFQYEIKY
jgi:hypothetical protein